ncbi:MAG: hypothetical protein WBG92_22930, partial [Thiohalocapsa sp.]
MSSDDPLKIGLARDQIGQRALVKFSKKRVGRSLKSEIQLARAAKETGPRIAIHDTIDPFEMAHGGADGHLARAWNESDTAAAAAHRSDETELGEVVDNFRKVVAGNLEDLADLGDADQPVVVLEGQEHEYAQRIVRVFRDVHRGSFQSIPIRLAEGSKQTPDDG